MGIQSKFLAAAFTITESDADVTIEFDNVTLIVRRR